MFLDVYSLHLPLRLTEIVEDDADLEAGEELLVLAVARALQGPDELGVVMDPVHQSVDSTLGGECRGVGHCQLRLAHGADYSPVVGP